MKKHISPLINQQPLNANKNLPFLWLFVHGGLFLAFGISLLIKPVQFNANLIDIIPASETLKSASKADVILGEKTSRQIVILSSSLDFSAARSGAKQLFEALEKDSKFESLSLYVDETYISRITRYLYDYRFMLLDRETIDGIENDPSLLAEDAIAAVYSPFTLTPLDNLAGDPFLLAKKSMQRFLASAMQSGNLSPRDDVLTAQAGEDWYVMLRGSLASKGMELDSRENAVKLIYEKCDLIKENNPGIEFFYSGVPFHSYESSSNAQREISAISTVSILIILALFILIFRHPIPVLGSLIAAVLSVLSGLTGVLLFFREVHVLSFVFGTTLIGTCVDYSIHFFVYRINNHDGQMVRSLIFRGIAMSFTSTIICFTAFLFAPFSILKQFSVFCLIGLLSSFLTVICIFPVMRGGKRKITFPSFHFLNKFSPLQLKCFRTIVLSGFFSLFIITLFINRHLIKVENSLGSLYSMTEKLLESEKTQSKVLNYGSTGWYFIVSGKDAQQLLQNEEKLCAVLDDEIALGNLGSYMAVSSFYPSMRKQNASYSAAEKLLPLAAAQFEAFGFDAQAAENYEKEFKTSYDRHLVPGGGDFPAGITANLWIGESGGNYYSCVLPLHAENEGNFRKIADGIDNVFFVNKVKDTGIELDRLTLNMMFLFLASFIVIFIIIRFFYSWKHTLKILLIPVLIILSVLTVLSCLKIPLNFFVMVGLFLVFALGLDYIFYIVESEKHHENRAETPFAIFLSFITTALAFGALVLSSFIPAHIFGASVFSGICAAYIFSTLLSLNSVSENQKNSGSSAER
jgi:predicted exporter